MKHWEHDPEEDWDDEDEYRR
ncbi:hypothetical protein PS2_230 [Serratia phage PS2]|uniref:Uncharacterized protein n=1 Tax=Serratia phage PS2 TaxID=1481112 RepID=A0A023W549_9CAUD|nr:hypothetical protein FF83_gp185 [Serratia phage PS2]AHY25469.1 hypothetical protein PS2_230 [Serratia phage PS2]